MKIGKFLIIPVLAVTLVGCGLAEWVKTAQQILPVVLPMVTNLVTAVTMLEGKTVSATDLNTISQTANQVSADLNLVGQLVNQYQSSPSPNTLSNINNALADVNTHLNELLPALHITDQSTTQKITAVVGLISSEVTSMEQILPLVTNGQAHAVSRAPVPMTASQLKGQYDEIVTRPTSNSQVNAAFARAVLK